MKKIFLPGIIVSTLLLAGCGCQKIGDQGTSGAPAADSEKSMTEKVKDGLYDIVTTGAGMKCTIEDPESGQLTMFAKGDKAKVEGFPYMGSAMTGAGSTESQKQEKGAMINDGTWVYMWSGKEGMKFNMKELEKMSPPDQQGQGSSQENATDWKSWLKDMDEEKVKYDCSPTVLSDADFTPPAGVNFADWGEMLKGFMNMGVEMQKNIPKSPSP